MKKRGEGMEGMEGRRNGNGRGGIEFGFLDKILHGYGTGTANTAY